MILRIAYAAFVTWGIWVLQTDNYPIAQGVRPSWYVYGWPLCFATSGRGRFNFSSFDSLSLAIDLTVALLMLVGTWTTARRAKEYFPRYSIADLAAATFGVAFLMFVASEAYVLIFELISFDRPSPSISEMAGESRPWDRTYMKLPLCVGIFSVAFAFASTMIARLNKSKAPEAIVG